MKMSWDSTCSSLLFLFRTNGKKGHLDENDFRHLKTTFWKLPCSWIIKWYGKTRVMSCELWVESLKARVKIQKWEFKSTSYEFKSVNYEFKSTSYGFKSTSHEFKSTSYKFKFTSYESKSTSSTIIKSMKTQRNITSYSSNFYYKLKNNKWHYKFCVTKKF